MEERKVAMGVLVLAALVWGVSGFSYKFFTLAGTTFITIFAVTRIFKLIAVAAAVKYRKARYEKIKNLREATLITLNGIFSTGTPVLFILALSYTSLSNTYFLNYTMPAWVLIFAVAFLGEKLTWKKAVALMLTIAGIFIIARPDGIGTGTGVMLALLSAFSYTGDVVTARELRNYSYHTVTSYTNVVQVVALAPMVAIVGLPQADAVQLALLAVIGSLLGLASYAYYYALEKIEASTAALINLLELFFASVLALIFLREVPSGSELVGYALIILAILIIILRKSDIENFGSLLHFHKKH